MIDIEKLKEAVVAIGYYIPNEAPIFHGTGFLVGEGDRALTCAHVVIPDDNIENKSFRSYPIKREINEKQAELSCWSFRKKGNDRVMLKLPIKNVATYIDHRIDGLFFSPFIDVAYLELEIKQSAEVFGNERIPALRVAKNVKRTIGLDVVMVGFPSTGLLLIDEKTGKPKCWEPLSQFAKLAGVLPFRDVPRPEYLAFDTIFAKGSSGSPIIDIKSSTVIAIAAQLHPFIIQTLGNANVGVDLYVPSSIGFGVPSNFFYELSLSRTGVGKFNI